MSDFFSPDLGNLTATAILGWFAWHIEGHNSAALLVVAIIAGPSPFR